MASLDLIDQDIHHLWEERGLNAISGNSIKSLFHSFVSIHQDKEEAFMDLFSAITISLVTMSLLRGFILFLPV